MTTEQFSLKSMRLKDKEKTEKAEQEICEAYAQEKYTNEQLEKLSKENKGLWYLIVWNEAGTAVEAMALMRPITRVILGYATTKMTDSGLYGFLEAAMRECWVDGDERILDDDEFFLPASNSFNKIVEGKKSSLLKR